jgi:hypothetical protein
MIIKFWKDKKDSIEKNEKAAKLDQKIAENSNRKEKEISQAKAQVFDAEIERLKAVKKNDQK